MFKAKAEAIASYLAQKRNCFHNHFQVCTIHHRRNFKQILAAKQKEDRTLLDLIPNLKTATAKKTL